MLSKLRLAVNGAKMPLRISFDTPEPLEGCIVWGCWELKGKFPVMQ
jgi:hypothetical protein